MSTVCSASACTHYFVENILGTVDMLAAILECCIEYQKYQYIHVHVKTTYKIHVSMNIINVQLLHVLHIHVDKINQVKICIRSLYVSQTYTVPFLSNPIPYGQLNCTGPLPLHPNALINSPSVLNIDIRLFPHSMTYTTL